MLLLIGRLIPPFSLSSLIYLIFYTMGVVQGLTGLAGAGITAGANTAATVMTNNANKQIAQMNNEFNEKMLNKQMDYNKEMYQQQLGDQWSFYNNAKENQWKMYEDTKEYNSASAQRERLEAAGLNPYLMMSGGNAGVATSNSAPAGSAPAGQGVNIPTASPYAADYSGLAQGVGQAIDAYNQIRLQKAQQGKISAEENNIRIEGKYKAASMIAEIANKMQNAKSQAAKTALETIMVGVQKDLIRAQTDKVKGETTYNAILARGAVVDNLMKSETLKVLPQQLQNSLAQQTADIAVKYAQRDLTKKQVDHEVEKIVNTIAQRGLIGAQTDAASIANNGAVQQQQYFADTYKIQKNKLIAEMRKAILNSGPESPYGILNFGYQIGDVLDSGLRGNPAFFGSYDR